MSERAIAARRVSLLAATDSRQSPSKVRLAPLAGRTQAITAPVVRNAGAERELTMMRWGMPPPPKFGGPPVTNIRNTS
jgi:putative SOS response-associated peptidase YedK